MATNLTTLPEILLVLQKAGIPAMVEGVHGIGKTSIDYQVWKKIRQERNQPVPEKVDTLSARSLTKYSHPPKDEYGLWAFAAPNLSIEELIGYPVADRDAKVLSYLRCNNFIPPEDHVGGGMLSCDELNLASDDIERALMSLMLEGRFLDYTLPPGIFIVTSQNPAAGEYHARKLNPPTLDRFCWLTVVADHGEVMNHFIASGLHEDILSFLGTNREALNSHQAVMLKAEVKKAGTSRGWEYVNRVMSVLTPAQINEGSAVGYAIIRGLLGDTAANMFISHIRNPLRNDLTITGKEIAETYGVTVESLYSPYDSFDTKNPKNVSAARQKALRCSRLAKVRVDVLNRALKECADILQSDAANISRRIGVDTSKMSMNDRISKSIAVSTQADLTRWANIMLFMIDCPADLVDHHFMRTVVTLDASVMTLSTLAMQDAQGRSSPLPKELMAHVDGKRKSSRFFDVKEDHVPLPGETSNDDGDGDDEEDDEEEEAAA